ncbi:hypothetical protein MAC_07557 [Metarhizium acridum CQMa 102]|uniref:Uncharacterized protein n=1 Tax=Metarhizium acridum (strain CQMa 102) TaxID=655827 RepID=E9ECF9_METAQ|nr:uncharacterized protein MAC_07557 [Metarhizium acridum CQMa 102]EFY86412.1 hypothetical protein MAC_07557 [Metarhizium acridum CQMa 102]
MAESAVIWDEFSSNKLNESYGHVLGLAVSEPMLAIAVAIPKLGGSKPSFADQTGTLIASFSWSSQEIVALIDTIEKHEREVHVHDGPSRRHCAVGSIAPDPYNYKRKHPAEGLLNPNLRPKWVAELLKSNGELGRVETGIQARLEDVALEGFCDEFSVCYRTFGESRRIN